MSVQLSNNIVQTADSFTIRTGGVATDRLIIDNNGRVSKPFQPAFDAVYTTPGGAVGSTAQAAIVFNAVNLNRGGHYNTTNGRFTAPVAGAYCFTMTGMTLSVTHYELRVNGALLPFKHAPYESSDGSRWASASSTWVISLNVNDYVQIFNANGGLYGGGNNHNNFSGFFIG